jgi:phosphoribosylglycinamide formyltransferase-1
MKRVAVLASYNGSVIDAIVEAIKKEELAIEIVLIITNNSDANVLQKAKKLSVDAKVINAKSTQDPDTELFETLKSYRVDLVLLAGYMKKLPSFVTENFCVINSHPSLLPKYGGKGMYGRFVHEAVVANAEKESGVTLHRVNEKYDDGEIILQKKLKLQEDETAKSLETKVKALEQQAVVEGLKKVIKTMD